MASLRTDSSLSRKWPSTCSAAVLIGAIALATVAAAQIVSPRGFSRNDAARRDKPSDAPSGLGRAVDKADLDAWDISVAPDGGGLPPGSGSAAQGALIWSPRGCADCHGPNGQEGPAPILVEAAGAHSQGECTAGRTREGGHGRIKHFPFAPLIFDFIRRAMPYDRPGRLSNDEVYALTAFLLFRNGIIEETDVMDAKSLAHVQMPHRAEYSPPPPWKPGSRRAFTIVP